MALILFFSGVFKKSSECKNCPINNTYNILDGSYEKAREDAGISNDYLQETWYYDYSNIYNNPKVIELKNKIINMSVEQAIREIANFTYYNVNYDLNVMNLNYCENNRASDILNNGKGVCSTQSRVNIALLRGLGIASKQVSGCSKYNQDCNFLDITGTSKKVPINLVKEDGKLVFGGGAHSWVEVWLPQYGWITLESTQGSILTNGCVDYQKYADQDSFNSTIDACSMDENIYGDKCSVF